MHNLLNSKKFRSLLWVFFIIYFLALIYVILLKFGFAFKTARMLSYGTLSERISYMQLIPGETIMGYLTNKENLSNTIIIQNLLGNIIPFAPLGFLLPLLCEKCKKPKNVFIISFLVTLSIELIQGFGGLGACDVDDLILNVIGALLGFAFYKILSKLFKST